MYIERIEVVELYALMEALNFDEDQRESFAETVQTCGVGEYTLIISWEIENRMLDFLAVWERVPFKPYPPHLTNGALFVETFRRIVPEDVYINVEK